MKLRLLEKAIKFKYFKYLLKKANSSLSLYFLVNNRQEFIKNISKEKGYFIQIPSRFLSLLLKKSSKLKWKWLNIFSGVIYLWVNFDYTYNILKIKPLLKINNTFLALGGFVRNVYMSRNSLLWFFGKINNYLAFKWEDYRAYSLSYFLVWLLKYSFLLLFFNYKILNFFVKQIENNPK